MIFSLTILSIIYYRLFQRLPKDFRSIEVKGFLYHFILIVCICVTNGFFLSSMAKNPIGYQLILINVLLLLVFIIISVINLYTYVRLGKTREKLQLEQIYNNTIQNFVDEISRIKHNYGNTLASLSGYIKLKKWDKLQEYLQRMSTDFVSVDSLGHLMDLNIKDAAILGLLHSKIAYAKQKGLIFNIQSNSDIDEIPTKIYLFTDVLGSIIDFSMMQAQGMKQKKLDLEIFQKGKDIQFIMKTSSEVEYSEALLASIQRRIQKESNVLIYSNFSDGLLTTTLSLHGLKRE